MKITVTTIIDTEDIDKLLVSLSSISSMKDPSVYGLCLIGETLKRSRKEVENWLNSFIWIEEK